MNAQRRRRIDEIRQRIMVLKVEAASLASAIDSILDDELKCLDSMPASLPGGEKVRATADALEYAKNSVNEAVVDLESADTNLWVAADDGSRLNSLN